MLVAKDKSGDGNCQFRFQMNYDGYVVMEGCAVENIAPNTIWPFNFHRSTATSTWGWSSPLVSEHPLPLNTWTHVALTRRRKMMSLYINGQLVRQHRTEVLEDHNTNHPLRVGSRLPDVGNPFLGEIDGAMFFPRAFSTFEVHELFRTKVMHNSTTLPPTGLGPWLKELGMEEVESQLTSLGADNIMSLSKFTTEQWQKVGIIYRRKLLKALEAYMKLFAIHSDATYDVYMAHSETGIDIAEKAEKRMLKLRPDLKVIRRVADPFSIVEQKEVAAKCSNLLLFLTQGAVDNSAIQEVVIAATKAKRAIIPILDERHCQFPSTVGLPEDVKNALYIKAVSWIDEEGFLDVSIDMITEKLV